MSDEAFVQLVRAAAFADYLGRSLHGQTRVTQTYSEAAGTEYVREVVDASAAAHAWADVAAEAARKR